MDFKYKKKKHSATNNMTVYIYSKVDTHYITHVFIHMHCNCPVKNRVMVL